VVAVSLDKPTLEREGLVALWRRAVEKTFGVRFGWDA
jgi:hypothetical protein